MLLREIFVSPITKLLDKSSTTKVQPVKRIVKTENDPDVKKKPVPKGRIDTYA